MAVTVGDICKIILAITLIDRSQCTNVLTRMWSHCRATELNMMKKGSFLINYARGDVIQKEVRVQPCMPSCCMMQQYDE